MLEKHREGFFPDTFTGWLLLMRSGLDAQERSAILAKTDDSLRQQDVEQALTRLWMDYDLRERDQKKGVSVQRGFATVETDGEEEADRSHHSEGDEAVLAVREEDAQEAPSYSDCSSEPEYGFAVDDLSDDEDKA